jgi:hypothetical protein
MIVLLPQTEQRRRNANEVASAAQSQLVSGCFIGSPRELTADMGYSRNSHWPHANGQSGGASRGLNGASARSLEFDGGGLCCAELF